MKTKNTYPPNIEVILTSGLEPSENAIYCYGDTIYNPSKRKLTPDVEHHEAVHSKQQNGNPEIWYNRYLTDSKFRLEQEVEAYAKQYIFAKQATNDKKLLEWLLGSLTESLRSDTYKLGLTFGEAEAKIRRRARQFSKSVV